jgi:hypothetical protein
MKDKSPNLHPGAVEFLKMDAENKWFVNEITGMKSALEESFEQETSWKKTLSN